MKYAHLIKLSVFSYENRDSENILGAFLEFFPFSLEDNRIVLKKAYAAGFNERKITTLEAALAKTNLINQFLKNLLSNLDANQKSQILQQAESRLDKNLDFFIRFDKDTWVSGRKLVLTDSGKCFHLRISIAAFPKKREVALRIINGLFSK